MEAEKQQEKKEKKPKNKKTKNKKENNKNKWENTVNGLFNPLPSWFCAVGKPAPCTCTHLRATCGNIRKHVALLQLQNVNVASQF